MTTRTIAQLEVQLEEFIAAEIGVKPQLGYAEIAVTDAEQPLPGPLDRGQRGADLAHQRELHRPVRRGPRDRAAPRRRHLVDQLLPARLVDERTPVPAQDGEPASDAGGDFDMNPE